MDDEAEITLMDFKGQPIYKSTVKTNATIEIDKQIPNGVYFLRINAGGVTKMIRVLRVQ